LKIKNLETRDIHSETMQISEEEIKDILKEDFESPSFGFSTKTMRLIEERQNSNEVYNPVKISRWVLAGVFSVFAFCILYAFSIDPISYGYSVKLILPQISVFWMWGFTLFGMAIGLWTWILLFQAGKIKLN